MGWITAAVMAALAGTQVGLRASGTIKEPGMPTPRAQTAGGGMSGIPYSKVGKGAGGIPYHTSGGGFPSEQKPMMIPNSPNTKTPDVLGALSMSGSPVGSMGGPMGMLANAPGNGIDTGGQPTGALSSGGMSPQMLQMSLLGLNAGNGIMQGQPIGPTLTGAAMQGMAGMAGNKPGMGEKGMMGPTQPGLGGGPMQGGGIGDIPPPPGADPEDFARFLEVMRAKQNGGGMIPGLGGGPEPGFTLPGGPMMSPGYGSLAGMEMPAERGLPMVGRSGMMG